MGNRAQWSFHTLRAHLGLGSIHLSCRITWMLLVGPPSWWQRGRPQLIDEVEGFSGKLPRRRHLGHLQRDVVPLADDRHPATRSRSSVRFTPSELRPVWHHKLRGISPYDMSPSGQNSPLTKGLRHL
jgi:hypothetical protein